MSTAANAARQRSGRACRSLGTQANGLQEHVAAALRSRGAECVDVPTAAADAVAVQATAPTLRAGKAHLALSMLACRCRKGQPEVRAGRGSLPSPFRHHQDRTDALAVRRGLRAVAQAIGHDGSGLVLASHDEPGRHRDPSQNEHPCSKKAALEARTPSHLARYFLEALPHSRLDTLPDGGLVLGDARMSL